MQPRDQRQLKLFNEFGFKCECEACEENWPTFKSLPVKNTKLLKIAKKVNDDMQQFMANRSQAVRKLQTCREILQENGQNFPSMELCILQKIFAALWLKMAESKVQF
jgi:arsenate reductase-like glutaredoxin family protein